MEKVKKISVDSILMLGIGILPIVVAICLPFMVDANVSNVYIAVDIFMCVFIIIGLVTISLSILNMIEDIKRNNHK